MIIIIIIIIIVIIIIIIILLLLYIYIYIYKLFIIPSVLIILRVKNIKLKTEWSGYSS